MSSRMQVATWMAVVLGFASVQGGLAAASGAVDVKALTDAMNPGEGQKKLDYMVGTFDVRMLTWLDPAGPPSESSAVAIGKWVLGGRYIQLMLSGFVAGEPFDAIGYAGYDNVAKKYVASYMDSASTGMEWYTGMLAPDGKTALLTATVHDAVTGQPTAVEMRIRRTTDGNHVTELWQAEKGGKMEKVMEVIYTRRSS